jgi:hypothetical protein
MKGGGPNISLPTHVANAEIHCSEAGPIIPRFHEIEPVINHLRGKKLYQIPVKEQTRLSKYNDIFQPLYKYYVDMSVYKMLYGDSLDDISIECQALYFAVSLIFKNFPWAATIGSQSGDDVEDKETANQKEEMLQEGGKRHFTRKKNNRVTRYHKKKTYKKTFNRSRRRAA